MCRFPEVLRRAVVVGFGSEGTFGPTIIRKSVQESVLDHYFLKRKIAPSGSSLDYTTQCSKFPCLWNV